MGVGLVELAQILTGLTGVFTAVAGWQAALASGRAATASARAGNAAEILLRRELAQPAREQLLGLFTVGQELAQHLVCLCPRGSLSDESAHRVTFFLSSLRTLRSRYFDPYDLPTSGLDAYIGHWQLVEEKYNAPPVAGLRVPLRLEVEYARAREACVLEDLSIWVLDGDLSAAR
jgi:hypothetical protein